MHGCTCRQVPQPGEEPGQAQEDGKEGTEGSLSPAWQPGLLSLLVHPTPTHAELQLEDCVGGLQGNRAISVLAGGGLCPWEAGTKRIIAVATAFFLLERRGLEEGPLSLCPLLSKRLRGWRAEEGVADRSSAAEENVPCQGNRDAHKRDRTLPSPGA